MQVMQKFQGMRISVLMALVVLMLRGGFSQNPPDLRQRADAVRATAAELKFKSIPWVTDLFEGFRLARAEARPVFLCLVVGDPLADC